MADRISVLLVEDEPIILMDIAFQLEAEGFKVYEATNADAAIKLLTALGHPVDFHRYRYARLDGRPQAGSCREGPLASGEDYRDLRRSHGEDYRPARRKRVFQQAICASRGLKIDA